MCFHICSAFLFLILQEVCELPLRPLSLVLLEKLDLLIQIRSCILCEFNLPVRQSSCFFDNIPLFTDYEALEKQKAIDEAALEREKKMQQALLDIKKKFGKNAILKGMNLQEGATTIGRNGQIGGHKA